MKRKQIANDTWLDLSDAAEYLGVHFTTLRRWADAGYITYIRTPGGRRRFSLKVLDQFLLSHSVLEVKPSPLAVADPPVIQPLQERAIDHARQSIQRLNQSENWMGRLSEAQRQMLKGTGHRLMILLIQFASRLEGGEVFLEEGKRITGQYSQVCASIHLSLQDTVRIFLFFRRSILDVVHETGSLGGSEDREGLRIYQRTTDFLDELLLHLIDSYPAGNAV